MAAAAKLRSDPRRHLRLPSRLSSARALPLFQRQYFNGNTFADIARTFSDYLFAELQHGRRREATSAVAHYVAGVLDRDSMAQILEELCEVADFQPGDRVKTLRGSTRGVIVRLLPDGRVVWAPQGSRSELVALPESLLREKPANP